MNIINNIYLIIFLRAFTFYLSKYSRRKHEYYMHTNVYKTPM